MNTLEKVLKLIDEKKEKTSLSDIALDKDIGLNRSSIANWRLGRGTPSTEAIVKIATYFNVSTDYLLGRTDSPKAEATDSTSLTNLRSDLVIPDILQQVGIGFNAGAEDLTQEDIDNMALAFEIGRRNKESQ